MSHVSRSTLIALALASLVACRNQTAPASAPEAPTAAAPPPATAPASPTFDKRVLVTGLTSPHVLLWGPDQQIWFTERTVGKIARIDPASGKRSELFTVPDLVYTGGQDGLVGFALHPDLGKGTGNDYVYVSLSIKADARSPQQSAQTVIRRYTWDARTQTLGAPKDLVTGLPHSGDHQSGRLRFGPDGKLYFSIGDQGANQLDNWCRANHAMDLPTAAQVAAKDWRALEGKILRLEPDGGIPADNPMLGGTRGPVYARGFRNAQGLAFAADGTLYQSEQGPKADDEVNRITAGGNYGWPYVSGFRDDKNYVFADWSRPNGVDCKSLTFSNFEIPASVPTQAESTYTADNIEPLKTFFTVAPGHNFKDPACAKGEAWNTCWPTVAPASLQVYESDGIPGWKRSLLMPTLKDGQVFRIALDADGNATTAETERLFETANRYRDVLVSADGRTFYVATDSAGPTKGADGAATTALENPGAILVFTAGATMN